MIVFIAILGSCLGSFCASLTSRIVQKKSLFMPFYSFCFFCGKRLKFFELIPIFSFLVLKAKCRTCKHNLPLSLIVSEILGMVLLVLAYFLSHTLYDFLFLSLFLFNFFLLSLFDISLKAVPQSLLWSAFLFALFYAFEENEIFYLFIFQELNKGFLLDAFSFGGFVFLFKSFVFYLMHFRKKDEIFENLGDADIVIMACIAGILGFKYAFLVFVFASFLTLPFFMALKIKAVEEQKLAMMPFLNIAFVGCLIYKNLGLIE